MRVRFSGPSPRGRGTRCSGQRMDRRTRSIPARAGNTAARRARTSPMAVHPRAGGEHAPAARTTNSAGGPSPRGRGTRAHPRDRGVGRRSIPARAGNTDIDQLFSGDPSVHPRAGGEHRDVVVRGVRAVRSIPARAGNTRRGSSEGATWPVHPRAGGEHRKRRSRSTCRAGPSPRGRGTRGSPPAGSGPDRSIPARAGNTGAGRAPRTDSSVHPRAGGEHGGMTAAARVEHGPSPRGRGTRIMLPRARPPRRSIPARAGNTLPSPRYWTRDPVHPRAGGEHRRTTGTLLSRVGPSPRGRGTRRVHRHRTAVCRSIPARAGNTTPWLALSSRTPVHPRAGGEHPLVANKLDYLYGPSPRGRGTPNTVRFRRDGRRSIPARAGNTGPCGSSITSRSVHPRAGGEHERAIPTAARRIGPSPRGRGTRPFRRLQVAHRRSIPARAGNTRDC